MIWLQLDWIVSALCKSRLVSDSMSKAIFSKCIRSSLLFNSSFIEIKPSYGLTEADITRMINESNNSAEVDVQLRKLNESIVEGKRVIYALEQALKSDGKELLSKDEFNIITDKLQSLKLSITSEDSVLIEKNINELEKESEFYVERRMNNSIKSFIAGKGIDDIL